MRITVVAALVAVLFATPAFASSGDGMSNNGPNKHSGVTPSRDAVANEAGDYVTMAPRKDAEKFVKQIAGDKNKDGLGRARTDEALYSLSKGRRANAGNLVETYVKRGVNWQLTARTTTALSSRSNDGSFDGWRSTGNWNQSGETGNNRNGASAVSTDPTGKLW